MFSTLSQLQVGKCIPFVDFTKVTSLQIYAGYENHAIY